jgi:hypothetical protein
MVVEVSYAEWTPDGLLRHVVYLGEREDKLATRCAAAYRMLASLDSHRYRQLSVEQDRSALNYGQANHQKAYGRKKCNGCYQP